ncbi:hypothetical protein EG68_12493, partial [Paragonimus skrjabini miyazakii]
KPTPHSELTILLGKFLVEVPSTTDLQSAYHQILIKTEAAGRFYQFARIPLDVTNGAAAFQRTIDNIIQREKLPGTLAYLDNLTICGNSNEDHDRNLTQFFNTARKYGINLNGKKRYADA